MMDGESKKGDRSMDLVLYGAELVGIVAFALSGAILAAQKGLDLFGVVFLGVVTSVGGGTVRDVLLGLTPPRMFYNYEYVALAVVTALALFLVFRLAPGARAGMAGRIDLLYNLCDAVGLGIFVVVGTQTCLDAGYADNAFLCIFLGMTSGVGGSILRDMMCAGIPTVLRKHVYALAAVAGSAVYYLLRRMAIDGTFPILCGMAVTVALRMLARHYRWNLPKAEED